MEQKKLSIDRRIIRTRQLLREALLSLIEERGYDGLSIQDITERANLGRTTFYEHYSDKEHLLCATVRDLFDYLEQQTQTLSSSDVVLAQKTITVEVFEHFAEHCRLYRVLLGERGAAVVGARLRLLLADLAKRAVIMQLVVDAAYPLPSDLLAQYAAGSLLALIIWWLEHEQPFTAEEMGRLFWKLMNEGLPRTLGLEGAEERQDAKPLL